jgi:hypothetical protein
MHFLSMAESTAWCEGQVSLTPRGEPTQPSHQSRYAHVPVSSEVAFCRQLENALRPRDEILLWVTESDVWRSSENLHLYYHLRQSYGDLRQLHEAPGHLFHPFEAADLVSFLQVGILSGWDMHLVPSEGCVRAFVSHDEFVDFTADDPTSELIDEFAGLHGGARIVMNAPAA